MQELIEKTPATPATPATLVQMAVESGADLDRLEKLMDMQEKWEAREAKKSYLKAMAGFQKECPIIQKDAHVRFETQKGITEYDHPSLGGMLGQVGDLMGQYGLVRSWRMIQDTGLMTVECIITHIDGHQESTSMVGPYDQSGGKNNIQAIGSTQKYLERYTFEAIIGAASGNDNDGNDSEPILETINEKQIEEICEKLKGKNGKVFLSWVSKVCNIKMESVNDIPIKYYDWIIEKIGEKNA